MACADCRYPPLLEISSTKIAELVDVRQSHGDVKAHLEAERAKKEEEAEQERRQKEIEARQGSFGPLLDGYMESLRSAGKVPAKEAEGIFDRHVRKAFPTCS